MNIKKILGVILIIAAVFFAGVLGKMYFFPEKAEEKEKQTSKNAKEYHVNIDDVVQNKDTVTKEDTKIKYDIPKELKNMIDMKKFDKALVKYLDENMLLTSNTTATTDDNEVTINFKMEYITFKLKLNNHAKSVVVCAIENYGKGDISFDNY